MDDGPFSVPFHDDCHSLLLKYMDKGKLDADVFYETVKAIDVDGGSSSRLNLDYGDASECMEQYWCTTRGTEWIIMSPLYIPELEAFFSDLPQLEATGSQVEVRGPGQHDPFSNFPPEIMVNIMSSLNLGSMGRFRLASGVARNIELGNHFWKQKVLNDMPWLFDIPDSASKSSILDWKRIYGKMLHASRAPSKSVIHGLANRRRIWKQMLPQIAPVYLDNLSLRQKDRAGEPEAFHNSRSTPSAILVSDEPKDAKATTVALLDTPNSVATTSVDLAVCFNKHNEISGLKATKTGRQISAYETQDVHRLEEITIPDEVWIKGFIVTTRGETRRPVGIEILFTNEGTRKLGETGEGAKRLIHVPRDNFAVGIRLHISKSQDLLCRLGLIYHQDWRAGDGNYRVRDRNSQSNELYNTHITQYLWHNELPSSSRLHATKPYRGYWAHGMQVETSPFEALVFPQDYKQFEDLVAIAADVQFGGFELRFANRPTRRIGPKHQAMKVLEIDGTGGEQISTFHICVSHIPTSIRIVTNRGRQLVIGQPDDREKRLPEEFYESEQDGSEQDGSEKYAVQGIFGYWNSRDSFKASLDFVGALYDVQHVHPPITDVSRRVGGLLWEPSALPTGIEASGPVVGAWEKGQSIVSQSRNVPDDCNLLSWLDFSRPVLSIRVTMCHSLDTNEVPLVGVQLKYAGEHGHASIGPSEFTTPPGEGTTASSQHWCWCQLAGAKIAEELEQAPHYQHHDWTVDGKHLSALRIFLATPERQGPHNRTLEGAEGKAATAIQFVAEDGEQSPVWGYWGRKEGNGEVQEIKFGKREGEAVGVKFFAAANGRSVTREDHTVQAFQALVRTGRDMES